MIVFPWEAEICWHSAHRRGSTRYCASKLEQRACGDMGGGWRGGLTPCWAEKYSVYTWYSNEGVKGYYKEAVQIYEMDCLTGLFIWPSQLERLTKQMREAEQRLKAIPQFCFPDAKDWSPVSEYNRYHCFSMRCSEFRILAVTEKSIIFFHVMDNILNLYNCV